jgi:nucleotide-binding universal stress UspA family protein
MHLRLEPIIMIRFEKALGAMSAPDATTRPFGRAVAAIDFSSASLGAARWATTYVAPRSEVIVAHIIAAPRPSTDDGHIDSSALRARLRDVPALRGGLGGFAATLDASTARTIVRVGQVSHWLSVLARETNASLVILGRRSDAHRRGIGEPSVLERTARRTRASVLMVPEGTTAPPHHIIVAVDRSAIAERALIRAYALARRIACPFTVLHVVSPTVEEYDRVIRSSRVRPIRTSAAKPTDAQPASAHFAATWISNTLRRTGVDEDRRIRVAIGDPAREIIATAEQHEAPLIVVGKRGDDGAPEGATGSVARELLARAPFPVLAVSD